MTATPASRDYSMFKGWCYKRRNEELVQIWEPAICQDCFETSGMVREYLITERNDAALNLSGLQMRDTMPEVMILIPFAGGPRLCPICIKNWRENKEYGVRI